MNPVRVDQQIATLLRAVGKERENPRFVGFEADAFATDFNRGGVNNARRVEKNALEGGAVQSASWATRERVTFDRARITSVNWDTYPVLRFSEVPGVAVRIVPSAEPATGAG